MVSCSASQWALVSDVRCTIEARAKKTFPSEVMWQRIRCPKRPLLQCDSKISLGSHSASVKRDFRASSNSIWGENRVEYVQIGADEPSVHLVHRLPLWNGNDAVEWTEAAKSPDLWFPRYNGYKAMAVSLLLAMMCVKYLPATIGRCSIPLHCCESVSCRCLRNNTR